MKGDQLVPYHRIRWLARRHEILLVSLWEGERELERLDELRSLCAEVHIVHVGTWRAYSRVALRAWSSSDPLQVLYYRSRKFEGVVRQLVREYSIDVVHGFMLRTTPYVLLASAPSIVDAMDSMQLRLRRHLAVERLPKRWLFREELRRIGPYERWACGAVDRVLVAAEQDRECLAALNVDVVANGVDTDLFAPRTARDVPRPPTIVFSGTMSYEPNVEAVRWFVERCLPSVQRSIPETRLVIAGARPTRTVRELGRREGVTVTGFVKSMAETLNGADVAIAPMRSGSGIQNKILEAMSCALPVVTTRIGLGGIAAAADEEIVITEGEIAFAAEVVDLLNDPARARSLGVRARKRIIESYSWERAANQVDALYRAVTTTRGVADY
jgi:sugar transferase (PEP-CTERM/EpsH1 system associated)